MPERRKRIKAKQAKTKPAQTGQKRLSPEIRRTQILDAAARMIAGQGYLPLSSKQLADATGVSKALLYTYFPTHDDLYNTLLRRELLSLHASGMDVASRVSDLDQAALLCAMLYFEHVAQSGPLLHILITDRYMADRIDAELTTLLQTVRERLVRLARKTLPLSPNEIRASIEMLVAIPEEAGNLAFTRELPLDDARRLCRSLVLSGLNGLRSPDSAIFGLEKIPRST